jgi:hypothetical protein
MATTREEKKSELAQHRARMVVFVPARLENLTEFARKVYYLAATQQRDVIYLALNRRDGDPLAAARQLATLAALTQDQAVRASALQVDTDDWAEALRQVIRRDDLVIWSDRRPASPADLAAELGITQQALPGFAAPVPHGQPWLRTAVVWLAALAILAIFSYIEFGLVGLMLSGTLKKAALIVLFALELGAFYQWDRMAH